MYKDPISYSLHRHAELGHKIFPLMPVAPLSHPKGLLNRIRCVVGPPHALPQYPPYAVYVLCSCGDMDLRFPDMDGRLLGIVWFSPALRGLLLAVHHLWTCILFLFNFIFLTSHFDSYLTPRTPPSPPTKK